MSRQRRVKSTATASTRASSKTTSAKATIPHRPPKDGPVQSVDRRRRRQHRRRRRSSAILVTPTPKARDPPRRLSPASEARRLPKESSIRQYDSRDGDATWTHRVYVPVIDQRASKDLASSSSAPVPDLADEDDDETPPTTVPDDQGDEASTPLDTRRDKLKALKALIDDDLDGLRSRLTTRAIDKLRRGPTPQDEPGYLYVYQVLSDQSSDERRDWFKIGRSKYLPRRRIQIQERKNQKTARVVYTRFSDHHKRFESIVHAQLHDYRFTHPDMKDGRTEWFDYPRDWIIEAAKMVRVEMQNKYRPTFGWYDTPEAVAAARA